MQGRRTSRWRDGWVRMRSVCSGTGLEGGPDDVLCCWLLLQVGCQPGRDQQGAAPPGNLRIAPVPPTDLSGRCLMTRRRYGRIYYPR